MRFLQIRDSGELSLVEPDSLPHYAILSHTWGPSNEEVTHQDLLHGTGGEKAGYRKLSLCGRQAAQDGFQYFWVDTCCIDKTSSAELSEAINSMYSWYQAADVCYAYLADVESKDGFSTSKWFTRGWTLQELLAPQEVIFFDGEWNPLGTRAELREQVSERTQIPISMLSQEKHLETFSVAQRMSWAAERKTSRVEDIAYCMLGIFDINMPLIYGEGENAFIRLQEEILRISDDHSLFAWRSFDNRGGCLATSPVSFRSSSNIIQCSALVTPRDPVILSSKGVHLDVRFMGIGHGRLGCAILNCCEQGRENERLAIYLRDKSLTLRHLERIKSEEFAQADFEAFVLSRCPIRRLCIQRSRIKSRWKPEIYEQSRNALSMAPALGGFSREQMDIGSPKSLLEAVQTGVEDGVWLILTRQDIDVNETDNNGQTALLHAACSNKEEIVQMLISRTDLHINLRDADGRTPMWWAAANGHKAVVKLLLETGKVNVNSIDNDGLTPLSKAVKAGDEAVVQLLLGVGLIDVDLKNNKGQTPLLWAAGVRESYHIAMEQRVAVVKLLLGMGKANVNSWDKDGRTPLAWAAEAAAVAAVRENYSGEMEQRVAVIKLLLETGKANANLGDKAGRTPLSWVAAGGGDKGEAIRKLLVQEMVRDDNNSTVEDGYTPLAGPVLSGDIAVLKLLLETGKVDVNSKNNESTPPLIKAVVAEKEYVVKLLLGITGVDVNIMDKEGLTPLSWAVKTRNETIFRLLFEAPEVEVDLKDKQGRTPLSWAVTTSNGMIGSHKRIFRLLFEAPTVDIDSKDNNGRTPLSWAVELAAAMNRHNEPLHDKSMPIVKWLLESDKVDVDSKDKDGRTPLSWAAGPAATLKEVSKYHRELVIKLLLGTSKVNVNSRDKNGRTPISWATAGDDDAETVCHLLVRWMVRNDAEWRSESTIMATLLSEAVLAGDKAVVEILLRIGKPNVNLWDEDGLTPLSRAVLEGNKEVLKLLLKTGKVDMDMKDKDGQTPLSRAILAEDEAVIELLKASKVDVGAKDIGGRNLLKVAAALVWGRAVESHT
jgi:ankyrin repeat protein